MINHIWIYCVLPLFAAVCCLFLLKKLLLKESPREYPLLFANLALMNILQFFAYLILSYSISLAEYFADAYLISVYFFFTHLILFAMSLSSNPKRTAYRNLLYFFPLLLTLFHFNGLMVESYRFENNALLHNDGELAAALDLFVFISCFAAVSSLWRNIKDTSNDPALVSKNIIVLLSFIPFILVACIIVFLSTTSHVVPVVIIVPTITLYTALSFYYLSCDNVVNLSLNLRTLYARLKLGYQLLETHKAKSDFKTLSNAVEKQFIQEALAETRGDLQLAADYLDISSTSLRNKIREYGLLQNETATSQNSHGNIDY